MRIEFLVCVKLSLCILGETKRNIKRSHPLYSPRTTQYILYQQDRKTKQKKKKKKPQRSACDSFCWRIHLHSWRVQTKIVPISHRRWKGKKKAFAWYTNKHFYLRMQNTRKCKCAISSLTLTRISPTHPMDASVADDIYRLGL